MAPDPAAESTVVDVRTAESTVVDIRTAESTVVDVRIASSPLSAQKSCDIDENHNRPLWSWAVLWSCPPLSDAAAEDDAGEDAVAFDSDAPAAESAVADVLTSIMSSSRNAANRLAFLSFCVASR